ncbi:MAG: hypothetical protein ACYC0T_13440 [Ramlibacter sp.]
MSQPSTQQSQQSQDRPTPEGDASDPRVWNILMLRAIVGLRNRDVTAAWDYHAFTLKHRGEEAAQACRESLKHYARSEAFKDAGVLLARAQAAMKQNTKTRS